jgi:hypothetical protein
LRLVIDNGQLTLFFVFEGRIYGSEENNRVVFAELKNSKDEIEKKYLFFTGYDLADIANGKSVKKPFGYQEIDSIKVVSDLEEVKYIALQLSEQDGH